MLVVQVVLTVGKVTASMSCKEECIFLCMKISCSIQVTADMYGGCTHRHTGTSVAAPFVAGFVALALETKYV